jgi:tight adherence protein C
LTITLLWAVLAAVGVFLLVTGALGTSGASTPDAIQARLAQYYAGQASLEQLGIVRPLDEIELSKPVSERILLPLVNGFAQLLGRFTPQHRRETILGKLLFAGLPGGLGVSQFVGIKGLCGAAGGIAGVAVFLLLRLPFPFNVGILLGLPLFGYFGPDLWLSRKIGQRRHDLVRSFPNGLDLLTIAVEAGLGFDAAMGRVVEKYDNVLSDELNVVLNEMRLGKPRAECLQDMARRTGVAEVEQFVSALIQSEQLGVGMAKILRIQSDEMRRRRRERAEEKANSAPVKMLIPMVGCIFPSLFVVILGPAALKVLAQIGHH